MKKILFIIIALLGLFNNVYSANNTQSRSSDATRYTLWAGGGQGGAGEYLVNLASTTGQYGMLFVSSNKSRAEVSPAGRWFFYAPESKFVGVGVSDLSTSMGSSVSVENRLTTEELSVTTFDPAKIANRLSITTTGTRSNIISYGDADGLAILSSVGQKIFLHDDIYFGAGDAWATFGSGRQGDVTINNPNSKWLRIGSNHGIALWGGAGVDTNNTPTVKIDAANTTFNHYMNINNGGITLLKNEVEVFVGNNDANDAGWIGTKSDHGWHLGAESRSSMYLDVLNNVYIGLTRSEIAPITSALKAKYKLFVGSGILSEDYAISPKNSWSDFVFDQDYSLRDLNEVEEFININNHLPDVPSAKDVATDGYSQHEMNKILLQKIEELTLYTIQQQKEIQQLKGVEN